MWVRDLREHPYSRRTVEITPPTRTETVRSLRKPGVHDARDEGNQDVCVFATETSCQTRPEALELLGFTVVKEDYRLGVTDENQMTVETAFHIDGHSCSTSYLTVDLSLFFSFSFWVADAASWQPKPSQVHAKSVVAQAERILVSHMKNQRMLYPLQNRMLGLISHW